MSTFNLTIEQFARQVAARYGSPVWLVGSYLRDPATARDVDLRVVVPDKQFAARYGNLTQWKKGEMPQRLLDDVAHFSALGAERTGLNVDFQIWPRSQSEVTYPEEEHRLLAAPHVRNWDLALLRFGREIRGQPLVWGETDCVSLARRAWEITFGADILGHEAHWTTLLGAQRVLKESGGLREVMLAHGARELPLTFAQTGDVAAGPADEGHAFPFIGVVIAREVLTTTAENGVIAHPIKLCPEGTTVLRWHDGP